MLPYWVSFLLFKMNCNNCPDQIISRNLIYNSIDPLCITCLAISVNSINLIISISFIHHSISSNICFVKKNNCFMQMECKSMIKCSLVQLFGIDLAQSSLFLFQNKKATLGKTVSVFIFTCPAGHFMLILGSTARV